MKVYFFGWPGLIGGADTKLYHLLPLLREEFDLTVVAPHTWLLEEPVGRAHLHRLNIPCVLLQDLPSTLEGWGVALCHGEFLSSGAAAEARRRGLRLVWSNEMMCLFPSERGALTLGLVDTVLYVSEAQRRVLEPQYWRILSGSMELPVYDGQAGEEQGWIVASETSRRLRWVMTGNYIDPAEFPFRERLIDQERPVVVGRLSRPDPAKFPPDFPYFYEGLGLRRARFRVMGWGRELIKRWPEHVFDDRWELLPPLTESASDFLQSLDLFVYSLHPTCRESWGRAVVEAMLSGAVPLVPAGPEHHLSMLVTHGETGFVCADVGEFGRYARQLEKEPELRGRLSRRARDVAVRELCRPGAHLESWRRVFYGAAADAGRS